MKNILIMGIGRAGKTTLSNLIKDKFPHYSLKHSDSLKWAMIRANEKEDYYREHVNEQKKFEHGEFFQKTLLELFNSLIRNDKKNYGYLLESGQLHPKIVNEMINRDNTIVICLGLGNLEIDEMISQCIKYDTKNDWTYGLSKEKIKEHATDWYNSNKMLKEECPKYNIPYIDTSKNRPQVLNNILNYIIKESGEN